MIIQMQHWGLSNYDQWFSNHSSDDFSIIVQWLSNNIDIWLRKSLTFYNIIFNVERNRWITQEEKTENYPNNLLRKQYKHYCVSKEHPSILFYPLAYTTPRSLTTAPSCNRFCFSSLQIPNPPNPPNGIIFFYSSFHIFICTLPLIHPLLSFDPHFGVPESDHHHPLL